ncbi:MAG: peptide chain release factor N(5)-glutamine methyltransferase [Verrucomicrobiota bacterium]|nr:peptide chain release factor N(5)-glutamine methyltransferase [Verrucomicrobiota bacterium]
MKRESFSVLEIFKKSSKYLQDRGIGSFKSDTEWIFTHILKLKRIDIFLDKRFVEFDNEIQKLRQAIIRRGKREPLQHIVGNVQFFNCKIKTDKRALIPRFETEKLIEIVVDKFPEDFKGTIIDFGTGSGAIIVSLAKQFPNAQCIGLDKCGDALALAKENIHLNNCHQNVELLKYDWSKDSKDFDRADLLISNPPYLSLKDWEMTEPEVMNYDPKSALVSENEGLSDLESILNMSPTILKNNGMIALEFGKGQCDSLSGHFDQMFDEVVIEKDLSGVRRFMTGRLKSQIS